VQQHPFEQELRSTVSLSAIFAFRMLGLFMILPIFSIAAKDYSNATPTLIGIALGAYGLSQALLQIPFGLLSDRIGRKPILITGLSLFALGSVMGGLATSLYGLILGRIMQGAGAIGSTIMATMADLTKVENRTKAMAVVGLTVGLSFALALVLGPFIFHYIGLSGLFGLTAVLALIGILIVIFAIPTPPTWLNPQRSESLLRQFTTVLSSPELLRLNYGIFITHALLTACFVALPPYLQSTGLSLDHQWQFYLPILICAFLGMIPFMIIAERYRQQKQLLLSAVAILALSQTALYLWHSTLWDFRLALIAFFTAFSLLEALLPSLVSNLAPIHSKGAALGIYSSSQFLGIFFGGASAGVVQTFWNAEAVFLYCAILAASWLIIALSMCKPLYHETKIIALKALNHGDLKDFEQKLQAIQGVIEITILLEHGIAYLKVDNTILDKSALNKTTQAYIRD